MHTAQPCAHSQDRNKDHVLIIQYWIEIVNIEQLVLVKHTKPYFQIRSSRVNWQGPCRTSCGMLVRRTIWVNLVWSDIPYYRPMVLENHVSHWPSLGSICVCSNDNKNAGQFKKITLHYKDLLIQDTNIFKSDLRQGIVYCLMVYDVARFKWQEDLCMPGFLPTHWLKLIWTTRPRLTAHVQSG